jgi:hypothetical protein
VPALGSRTSIRVKASREHEQSIFLLNAFIALTRAVLIGNLSMSEARRSLGHWSAPERKRRLQDFPSARDVPRRLHRVLRRGLLQSDPVSP